ncbi:MAG: cation:proton antiporter, partial [Muribaculaceae bacterium]|nr:cation:proton antiporter [Muribaculaceae bacterium]
DIRCEFRTVEGWDDFILLGNRILDDYLFVIIGARANSVSYASDMADMPAFLQRYFSRNNLMVIYPEQFGAEVALTSFTDPLSSDISASASPLWLRMKSSWRRLVNAKRRFTHRHRKPKY